MAWLWGRTGHFLATPTISVSPFTIDRIDYRLMVMWLGWSPSPSTGHLVWSQEVVSPGYITPIDKNLSWSHPCRFLEVSLDQVFTWPWNELILVISFSTVLHSLQIPHVSILFLPQSTHKISTISKFHNDMSLSVEFSSLTRISRSMDIMAVLYFTTNIHLKWFQSMFVFLSLYFHTQDFFPILSICF